MILRRYGRGHLHPPCRRSVHCCISRIGAGCDAHPLGRQRIIGHAARACTVHDLWTAWASLQHPKWADAAARCSTLSFAEIRRAQAQRIWVDPKNFCGFRSGFFSLQPTRSPDLRDLRRVSCRPSQIRALRRGPPGARSRGTVIPKLAGRGGSPLLAVSCRWPCALGKKSASAGAGRYWITQSPKGDRS